MNAILALQDLPEATDGLMEPDGITGLTSHISVFSDCSSEYACPITL